MPYLVLSGEFSYAQESWHRFIKAFIAVRIIKAGRQFVQPQADFRRNSIVTIYFLPWRFNFCDNQIPDRLLSMDWVRTNADVKSWWGAYGFGTDFQIQCILYGRLQNPDCAVRIAVKRLLVARKFGTFPRINAAKEHWESFSSNLWTFSRRGWMTNPRNLPPSPCPCNVEECFWPHICWNV